MPLINSNDKIMQKTVSMIVTVPQVMAHRLWMYANVNPFDFHNQQQEYQLMFVEKQQALFESVQNIHQQALDSQLQIVNEVIDECMNSWRGLFFGKIPSFERVNKRIENETLKIIDKGITPYSKRVKANNKRLNDYYNR